jgi:hypothetical protein
MIKISYRLAGNNRKRIGNGGEVLLPNLAIGMKLCR